MKNMSFTLDDFLEQLGQVRNMGPLEDLIQMMPGAGKMKGLKTLKLMKNSSAISKPSSSR